MCRLIKILTGLVFVGGWYPFLICLLLAGFQAFIAILCFSSSLGGKKRENGDRICILEKLILMQIQCKL